VNAAPVPEIHRPLVMPEAPVTGASELPAGPVGTPPGQDGTPGIGRPMVNRSAVPSALPRMAGDPR
jgi:hypothetical protein